MSVDKQILRDVRTKAQAIAAGGDYEMQPTQHCIPSDWGSILFRHLNSYYSCLDMAYAPSSLEEGAIPYATGTAAHIETNPSQLFWDVSNLRLGVGCGFADLPESTVEIKSNINWLTITNSENEDTVHGRETIIRFKGYNLTTPVKHTLGIIRFDHDDDGTDQKGYFTLQVNDGADGNSPTTRMTIDSQGGTTFWLNTSYNFDIISGVLANPFSVTNRRLFGLAGADPGMSIINITSGDGSDARISEIRFMGYTSANTIHTLVRISGSHYGAALDQKGIIKFYINDGNDSDAPTEVFDIDSDGVLYILKTPPDGGDYFLTWNSVTKQVQKTGV